MATVSGIFMLICCMCHLYQFFSCKNTFIKVYIMKHVKSGPIWMWPSCGHECCVHMFSTTFLVEQGLTLLRKVRMKA